MTWSVSFDELSMYNRVWALKVSIVLSVIKRLNTNHENDSDLTFGVQMWLVMQISSLTPQSTVYPGFQSFFLFVLIQNIWENCS